MDPIHSIAAQHVSRARGSKPADIQAFYDDNAFSGLHAARRTISRLAHLLGDMRLRLAGQALTAPEIASAASRR